MQIVIDIPEKEYKRWQDEGEMDALIVRNSLVNGTPLNEQEPKTGRWILADEQNKEDVENDNYRFICSECQCSDIHAKDTIVPYCWKCGTRMVESEE